MANPLTDTLMGRRTAAPTPPPSLRQLAFMSAARVGIPANVFLGQIQQESHFDPNITSGDGGMGIAQFMPATARQYHLANPYDPVSALRAAAQYDRDLLNQYGSIPRALSAYNSGSPTGDDAYVNAVMGRARTMRVPTVRMADALRLGLPAATARVWSPAYG